MPDEMKFGDLICYRLVNGFFNSHDYPVMFLGHADEHPDLIVILPLTPPFMIDTKAEEAWQLCTHVAPDA